MIVSVVKADYIGEFKVHFIFSDGVESIINFSDFLNNTKTPSLRKYLNEQLFRNYSIQAGDIVWNDYEMCFPLWSLHEGKI